MIQIADLFGFLTRCGKDRAARSAVLDVAMASGFGSIEDATFTRGVRFEDNLLVTDGAPAAMNRYNAAKEA